MAEHIVFTAGQLKEAIARMKAAASAVYVGIPAGESSTESDDGRPIDNATLGLIHEFGAPSRGIPARPFLYPAALERVEANKELLAAASGEALRGNNSGMRQHLERAGIETENVAKDRVRKQVGFQALKAATIKARQRKGYQGESALIRTGAMLGSITHLVEAGGE